jgi:GT2 family glycosyltransferase
MDHRKKPFISIVLATFNRPSALDGCLRAMCSLIPPEGGFELVVVDDGGTSDIRGLVETFTDKLPIVFLRIQNGGCGIARNAGAGAASGSFVAFTDDDCRPDREWLTALERTFVTHPEVLAGGRTVNGLPENLCSTASQLLIDYLHYYFNRDPLQSGFANGSNMALSRQLFLSTGGFSEAFRGQCGGEDLEFCRRWRASGRPMIYTPSAVVHHYHHLSLRSFLRQHLQYGFGAGVLQRLAAQGQAPPIRIAPPNFYTGMFCFPFRNFSRPMALAVALLLVAAQGTYAAGYLSRRSRGGPALDQDPPS